MYARGRLVGPVPEVPLGGAVFAIEVEEDLDEKVEVGVPLKFLPNVSTTAVGVGVCVVDL